MIADARRPAIAVLAILSLAACGFDFEPAELRDQDLDQDSFTGALADAYLRLAEAEAAQGDWRDADALFLRAERAAAGEEVPPEDLAARDLPPDLADELAGARARLMLTLDRGARVFAPREAARTQVQFDCWLEQLEEQRQPDDIAACREEFDRLLRDLEERLSGDILVLLPDLDGSVGEIVVATQEGAVTLSEAGAATLLGPDAAAPEAPVAMDERTVTTLFGDAIAAQPEPPARFLLYFETGQPGLVEESEATFQDVVAEVERRAAPNISVIGHTDTVGPAALNARLAVNRAALVRDLLEAAGVDPARIETTSFGESLLLVVTDDNVDEPLNRRVEVIVR